MAKLTLEQLVAMGISEENAREIVNAGVTKPTEPRARLWRVKATEERLKEVVALFEDLVFVPAFKSRSKK
jgi:hypothetical protein